MKNNKSKSKEIAIWIGGILVAIVFGCYLINVSLQTVTGSVTENVEKDTKATEVTIEVPKVLTPSIEEIKSNALTISYDNLMRHNENYIGKIVYYKGEVLQAMNAYGDKYVLRIATKEASYGGYFEDVIWANYEGERLLDGDIIEVWGKVKGLKAYTAILGNEIIIPEIDSIDLKLIKKAGDDSLTITSNDSKTQSEPEVPKVEIYNIGDTVTVEENPIGWFTSLPPPIRITLNDVKFVSIIKYPEHESLDNIAPPNKEYIILDLSVENYSQTEATSFGFAGLPVVDEEGYAYDVDYMATNSLEHPLWNLDIMPNMKRRGEIAYLVPTYIKDLKLPISETVIFDIK